MAHNDDPTFRTQAPARVVRNKSKPGTVFVADCSGSMSFVDGEFGGDFGSGPRRIDRLARVLGYLLGKTRLRALVCFSDLPVEVELRGHVALPEPAGGTDLALALSHVRGIEGASRVIVLSDGSPNDEEAALREARSLRPVPIDAYYVGRDGDRMCLEFMRRLSSAGGPGGRSGEFDLAETELVAEALRLRIEGPR